MISKKKIKETLIKIKQQNWEGYKLYFIGGVIEDRKTKDIDIFIVGNGNEKKLIKSINNVQERGLVDFFVVDYLNDETLIHLDPPKKFAKTYPVSRGDLKEEDYLYWRDFKPLGCKPCSNNRITKNIEKPLLIYNGVI